MPHSTTIPSLHRAPVVRPSFVQLYVTPLWQRTLFAATWITEVWCEARALEHKLTAQRVRG
jgi:hypothetical protein